MSRSKTWLKFLRNPVWFMPAKHLLICIKHVLLLILWSILWYYFLSLPKEKKGKRQGLISFVIYAVKAGPLQNPAAYRSLVHHGHGFHQGLWRQLACGKWNQLCSYLIAPSLSRRREQRGILWCLCRTGFFWLSRCLAVQLIHTSGFGFLRLPARMALNTHQLVFVCVPHKT